MPARFVNVRLPRLLPRSHLQAAVPHPSRRSHQLNVLRPGRRSRHQDVPIPSLTSLPSLLQAVRLIDRVLPVVLMHLRQRFAAVSATAVLLIRRFRPYLLQAVQLLRDVLQPNPLPAHRAGVQREQLQTLHQETEPVPLQEDYDYDTQIFIIAYVGACGGDVCRMRRCTGS